MCVGLQKAMKTPWRDFAYVESNYWGRAVVADRYKYVTEYKPADPEDFRPPGPDASRLGRAQLFDLQEDPWETQNLASQSGYEGMIDSVSHKPDCSRSETEPMAD